jgi:hypothetical protein
MRQQRRQQGEMTFYGITTATRNALYIFENRLLLCRRRARDRKKKKSLTSAVRKTTQRQHDCKKQAQEATTIWFLMRQESLLLLVITPITTTAEEAIDYETVEAGAIVPYNMHKRRCLRVLLLEKRPVILRLLGTKRERSNERRSVPKRRSHESCL